MAVADPAASPGRGLGRRRPPLAAALGILASLLLVGGISARLQELSGIGSLVALAYVAVLSFGLAREIAADRARLDAQWQEFARAAPARPPRPLAQSLALRFAAALVVIVVAVFVAVAVIGNGWSLVVFCVVPAAGVLIVRRLQLSARVWASGVLALAAMLLLEGVFRGNVMNGAVLGVVLAPQVMAGVVLVRASRIARVWSLEGRFSAALRAFALGCLLAVPPALMNASGMTTAMVSDAEASFGSVWSAFYALQPALLEEGWARLFLLPLLYVTFRSASGSSTGRAVLLAVLLSVAVHGLAHAPHAIASVTHALLAALVYGIPLALLFVRRGLECAIGYHFFIDFVRFGYVVLLLHG